LLSVTERTLSTQKKATIGETIREEKRRNRKDDLIQDFFARSQMSSFQQNLRLRNSRTSKQGRIRHFLQTTQTKRENENRKRKKECFLPNEDRVQQGRQDF
jgi:hypothetical protein